MEEIIGPIEIKSKKKIKMTEKEEFNLGTLKREKRKNTFVCCFLTYGKKRFLV